VISTQIVEKLRSAQQRIHQQKTPVMTIAKRNAIKKVPGPAIADCRDPLSTVTGLGF
jgi:hypothetical protein